MTDGTATASPATVVTSASATPGATAAMLPDPPTAIPMNASITPSTVPSSPRSGLTEPNVASQGMKRAAASRSAATSFASTMRSASSCVVVSAEGRHGRAVVLQPAGLQLGKEIDAFAQQPVEGRGGQSHGGVVGVVQPRRPLDLRHEAVGLPAHPAKLPPLEEDEIPGNDGEHDEDGEHELGLATRRENQLPGRRGDRPAHLKEHAVSPP